MTQDERAADVLAYVKSHYEKNDRPLFMSELGTRFPSTPGTKRLASLISDDLGDQLVMFPRNAEKKTGAIVVAPKADEEQVRKSIEEGRKQAEFLRGLPRSLLIAFCKTVPDGSRIYYKTKPKFGYVIGSEPPDDSYVEVETQYRRPSIYVNPTRMGANDRQELLSAVGQWFAAHELDPTKLRRETNAPVQAIRALRAPTNALERFLSIQDPEIRPRILVPADIAEILLRH